MEGISFCIITSGAEDDQLRGCIASIQALNIPNYEVVIVGGASTTIEQNEQVRWFPFDENAKAHIIVDNKPGRWITRKKNLTVEHAQYDVCVVTHDYILFDRDWYKEYLAFGTHWDICVHQTQNYLGVRADGWRIDRHPLLPRGCMVPYDMIDLVQYMGIQGNYQCIKRQRWLENPMNEDILWGQGEEMEWNRRIVPKFHIQCNPKCIVRYSKPKSTDHDHIRDAEIMNQNMRVFEALRECRMEFFKMWYEPGHNNNERTIWL